MTESLNPYYISLYTLIRDLFIFIPIFSFTQDSVSKDWVNDIRDIKVQREKNMLPCVYLLKGCLQWQYFVAKMLAAKAGMGCAFPGIVNLILSICPCKKSLCVVTMRS